MPGMAHFVTYRLAGTIPLAVLGEWRADRPNGRELGIHRPIYQGDVHVRQAELAVTPAHCDAGNRIHKLYARLAR